MLKRWTTEFVGIDGHRYAGPLILDESQQGAEAILSVLLGPNGQAMHVTGELVWQRLVGENTETAVRQVM